MENTKQKKSVWESRALSTKVKTADVKLFPEAALGYLIGPAFALIANAFVNTYLSQYWSNVLQLGTWASTFSWLMPLIATIAIVLGNLLVGRLFERKPTLAGKARPYILVGMPLMAIALLILFLVPYPTDAVTTAVDSNGDAYIAASGQGSITTLVFITVGYILYYAVAYPFYYTSHSALVNLSTRNNSKRSLLSTASNAAQIIASGAAGMIAPYLIDALNLLPDTADISELESANSKWVILMVILIVVQVIGCLLEYYFTRERITEETIQLARETPEQTTEKSKKKVSTSEQAKICVHDKYWWFIIIFYFLYQLGGQLKNNDASWFSQAYTGATGLSGTINIVGAIPTAIGMFIIWPLAEKFGKSNCIKTGAFFAFLMGCLGFLCIPYADNTAAVTGISITAFALKAIGTVPAMYVSMALLSNVLEHQESLYGIRTDGFTMSVYGSIMIAMPGIANAIIIAINNVFPTGSANQIANTSLYFGGEAVCYLLIAILFIGMNVEKFSDLDQKAIMEDQKEAAEKKGIEWVDPAIRLAQEQADSEEEIHQEEIAKLRKRCETNNAKRAKQISDGKETKLIELNFDTELANYEAERAKKAEAAAQKKADNERRAQEKKATKEAELQAKLSSMSTEERERYDAKQKAKAQKAQEKEAEYEALFAQLRDKTAEARAVHLSE